MELRQCLRNLQILHIDKDNDRHIKATDQIEVKITKQTTARSVCCTANDTHVVHVLFFSPKFEFLLLLSLFTY